MARQSGMYPGPRDLSMALGGLTIPRLPRLVQPGAVFFSVYFASGHRLPAGLICIEKSPYQPSFLTVPSGVYYAVRILMLCRCQAVWVVRAVVDATQHALGVMSPDI